jgi:hypothetical protein
VEDKIHVVCHDIPFVKTMVAYDRLWRLQGLVVQFPQVPNNFLKKSGPTMLVGSG